MSQSVPSSISYPVNSVKVIIVSVCVCSGGRGEREGGKGGRGGREGGKGGRGREGRYVCGGEEREEVSICVREREERGGVCHTQLLSYAHISC